jgi:hypothetical protein
VQSPGGSSAGAPDAAAAGPAGKAAPDAGPAPRQFAGSTAEATSMISEIVDQRQHEIFMCVHDFRTRKNLARERVAISFGIDQEGKLLGVTSKGKEDSELQSCVQGVLRSAPFPRSHSGVITVTKTYEELVL